MRFIFFTKTDWVESPRLRHQLAHLLANAGHEVVFFEFPVYPWQHFDCSDSGHPRIHLYRYRQFLHHKLRLHPLLHYCNAAFEKSQIARMANDLEVKESDVIVNFNYDYYFLRDLFPNQRLITIINDDFWSTAIAGYEKPLRWALERTCKLSDVVLTVSPILAEQLKAFCKPEIFYPWTEMPYQVPPKMEERSVLLYWGYIGRKIDYEYVLRLSRLLRKHDTSIRIVFVGPIVDANADMLDLVRQHIVEHIPTAKLNELNLDQVFGGLIPYRSGVKTIDVISIPNKAFQLLCHGIPLLITGMPNFLETSVVYRLNQGDDVDYETIKYVRDNFQDIQDGIRELLSVHSADHRLAFFMQQVNSSCAA